MRILLRMVFVIALVGVTGAYYAPDIVDWWTGAEGLESRQDRIAEARISLCWQLSNSTWTTFPLSGNTGVLKIVSNAEVSPSNAVDDVPLLYSIRYEVLDRDGNVLKAGVYHFHSKVTWYKPPSGKRFTSAFYLDVPMIPADGRIMLLNMARELERAVPNRLRLRLEAMHPPVKQVTARAYIREARAETQLAAIWNRLSTRQKEKLAEGNVYPHDYLTDVEKAQLLQTRFRPVGPLGVVDRDYAVRKMYVLREIEGEPPRAFTAPAGLHAGPKSNATLAVGEDGAHLEFVFTPLNASAAGQGIVRWYGRKAYQRDTTAFPVNGTTSHAGEYGGGLLELGASMPATLRVFDLAGGERIDVTPKYKTLRAYRGGDSGPVEYRIRHERGRPAPFRLAFRAILSGDRPESRTVMLMLTNSDGEVIRWVPVHFTAEPSVYDALPGLESGRLSVPASRYFMLPPEVHGVAVAAPADILVAGYNRPVGMKRVVHVPADYFREEKQTVRIPSWFFLHPANARELIEEMRSNLLRVQFRPPETDPRIERGLFSWEQFRPSGSWTGRNLLVPLETGAPVREKSLNVRYHPVPVGRTVVRRIEGVGPVRAVRPKLLYLRSAGRDAVVNVFVDGKRIYSRKLIGRRGELRLPAMAVGTRKILVECAGGGRFFLSNCRGGTSGYLTRFGIRLTSKGLRFAFRKNTAGEEDLSMVFYSADPKEGAVVDIRLKPVPEKGLGPFEDWTVTEREYQIQAGDNEPVPVLNTRNGYAGSGRTLFFPLGGDLPPGNYHMSVSLKEGAGGYVILYRVTPGEDTTWRVGREPDVQYVY